jgi:tetratricopeptide (TPR) repeat protein
VLRDAEEQWESVFPTLIYQPLVRLLRFVENALVNQNERVLREDDPDFDKLAPLLSQATQAVSAGLYEEAAERLEQFLRAQPNNLEARLLEVDIALGGGEGDIESKIDRLIENSLPEGASRSDLEDLDPGDQIELQSLLIALLERLRERTDVPTSIISRIQSEYDTLEVLLNPPRAVQTTPAQQANVDALVARALSNGPLATLSRSELATALDLLERALDLDPNNEEALQLFSQALRLPNAPRRQALDADEQQFLKEARDAFARGDLLEASIIIERLWQDPSNQNDTELNRFREELQDARARGQ